MLEIVIEEILGRRGTTFIFHHDGHRCFCFMTTGRANTPRLRVGMRLVVEGRWSPAVPRVFEAHSVIVLSGPD